MFGADPNDGLESVWAIHSVVLAVASVLIPRFWTSPRIRLSRLPSLLSWICTASPPTFSKTPHDKESSCDHLLQFLQGRG
jgi:hypothetical protein